MRDFMRFLPLSQRTPTDESMVSSDWRTALAAVLDAVFLMIPHDSPRSVSQGFLESAGLAEESPDGNLPAAATRVRTGRRRPIRALSRAVTAQLRLARDLGVTPSIDPLTLGAVALHRTGAAPLEIRAVIKGHTLRATDADWSFGHGPVLEGTALDIVAFLFGVSDEAPKAAAR